MNVSMRPSGSGTPTSGQSEQRMAHRDDEEQLPSNNDTGSSSNGTTLNLLSLSSNNPNMMFLLAPSSCSRRTSEDGIDLHDSNIGNHSENASSRKRVCDEAHAKSTEDKENNNAQPSRQARKAKTMPLVSNESIHTPILQNSTNVPRRTSKRRRKTSDKYNNAAAPYNHHAGTGDMDVEEDIDTVLQFTDGTTLTFGNISTSIIESARTMADYLNVNYITSASSASRIMSIIQNNEMTIDERVEEIYKLSQQLPCWNSLIVTSILQSF